MMNGAPLGGVAWKTGVENAGYGVEKRREPAPAVDHAVEKPMRTVPDVGCKAL
jgi:hypothetical protein